MSAIDIKPDSAEVHRLMKQIIKGTPTELTESSLEVMYVREIMEKEGTWEDYDFGGSVYWNKQGSTVLIKF